MAKSTNLIPNHINPQYASKNNVYQGISIFLKYRQVVLHITQKYKNLSSTRVLKLFFFFNICL